MWKLNRGNDFKINNNLKTKSKLWLKFQKIGFAFHRYLSSQFVDCM